jgi:hypothetical protein
MEQEANASRRMDGLEKQRRKKEFFTDRLEPNILLTGWRAWWTRMVAESRISVTRISNSEPNTNTNIFIT